jgi:hypothetical protein
MENLIKKNCLLNQMQIFKFMERIYDKSDFLVT